MIAAWELAESRCAVTRPIGPRADALAMKPTVISAEALFEEHRADAALGMDRRPRAPRAPLRRGRGARRALGRRPGRLPQLHPSRTGCRSSAGARSPTSTTPTPRRRRAAHLAHRHARAAGADRAPTAQVPPDRLVAMCDRADIPLFVTERVGRPRDRRACAATSASTSPSGRRATACSWTSSASACCSPASRASARASSAWS